MARRLLLALLAVAFASPVGARSKKDTRDQITDPYMLQEIKNVSDANLTNALENARPDASASAERLRGLMTYARGKMEAHFDEIYAALGEPGDRRGHPMVRDAQKLYDNARKMSTHLARFSKATRKAGLKLQEASPDKILRIGRLYHSQNHAEDLKRSARNVTGAVERLQRKKIPPLEKEEALLLKEARAFQGWHTSFIPQFSGMRHQLWNERETKQGRRGSGLIQRFDAWLADIKQISDNIDTEIAILENQLTLIRCDEEDF